MGVVDSVVEGAAEAWDDTMAYLSTPQGRRVRHRVAAAVIVATPILTELPVIRRTPVGRLLRYAAVGALMVKGAEWLRDWEPQPAREAGGTR